MKDLSDLWGQVTQSLVPPRDGQTILVGPASAQLTPPERHNIKGGAIDHCPICRVALPAPARSHGPALCPRCNENLWHLALPSGPAFFVRRPGESIYDFMAAVTDPSRGFTADDLKAALRRADRLAVAELFTHLEFALRPNK